MENCVEQNMEIYETEPEYPIDKIEDNMYSSAKLELMKNKIENMEKIHHIEILRILKRNNNVKLNENKSGIFINLTFLPKTIIDEIYKYIQYIEMQEYSILNLETKQDECKTLLLEKQDKEITLSYNSVSNKQHQ
jgi:hypothetical protein